MTLLALSFPLVLQATRQAFLEQQPVRFDAAANSYVVPSRDYQASHQDRILLLTMVRIVASLLPWGPSNEARVAALS
jgi:hypothetical protein